MRQPLAYLLSGLPCSGKSTYARALERTGIVRLSVDELMHERHGRPGKDYAGELQPVLEEPLLREVREQVTDLLRAGHSVVLDHGLGTRVEREKYKRLVTDAGGRWRLVRFDVDHAELRRRLAQGNADPAYGDLPESVLEWMIRGSEPPSGEGEEAPDPRLTK